MVPVKHDDPERRSLDRFKNECLIPGINKLDLLLLLDNYGNEIDII